MRDDKLQGHGNAAMQAANISEYANPKASSSSSSSKPPSRASANAARRSKGTPETQRSDSGVAFALLVAEAEDKDKSEDESGDESESEDESGDESESEDESAEEDEGESEDEDEDQDTDESENEKEGDGAVEHENEHQNEDQNENENSEEEKTGTQDRDVAIANNVWSDADYDWAWPSLRAGEKQLVRATSGLEIDVCAALNDQTPQQIFASVQNLLQPKFALAFARARNYEELEAATLRSPLVENTFVACPRTYPNNFVPPARKRKAVAAPKEVDLHEKPGAGAPEGDWTTCFQLSFKAGTEDLPDGHLLTQDEIRDLPLGDFKLYAAAQAKYYGQVASRKRRRNTKS
jgi:hypothetical protein